MPNEYKQVGNQRIQLTDAEQATLDASRVKSPEQLAAEARDAALATIYEPVEYNGTLYPADQASMAKYEMAKQSRTRGKATKGIAVAVDGSVLKLSTPAEIDSFHGAIEDAIVARLNAAHDAL
jgi:hypothetical protein